MVASFKAQSEIIERVSTLFNNARFVIDGLRVICFLVIIQLEVASTALFNIHLPLAHCTLKTSRFSERRRPVTAQRSELSLYVSELASPQDTSPRTHTTAGVWWWQKHSGCSVSDFAGPAASALLFSQGRHPRLVVLVPQDVFYEASLLYLPY